MAKLTPCDICGEMVGGWSHWHCGHCRSKDVTGSYGHWTGIHLDGHGSFKSVEFHHCVVGECEESKRVPVF